MKLQDFLPDVENYTFGDWCVWFGIVFTIGVVVIGVIEWDYLTFGL